MTDARGGSGSGGSGGSKRGRRAKPLRVRTPTDILQEQVGTPELSHWWPQEGLRGAFAIDSSEQPRVVLQSSARFRVGCAHRQGLRPSMEDRSVVCGQLCGRRDADLFAVFDGHGSRGEADLAAAYLPACVIHELADAARSSSTSQSEALRAVLVSAFRQTSNAMRAQGQGMMTGTTAVAALVIGGELVVANVGDSNAVLSFADGSARTLSVEHKPSLPSERTRIESMDGGLVTVSRRNGIARVQGQLAVSRALGDFHLEPYVTAEPSCAGVDLAAGEGGGAEFLILACDGVWDVLNAHQACTEVRKAVAAQGTMEAAAVALCEQSLARGSTDNISVVVVDLRAELGQRAEPEQPSSTRSSSRSSPPGHMGGLVEVAWNVSSPQPPPGSPEVGAGARMPVAAGGGGRRGSSELKGTDSCPLPEGLGAALAALEG